MSFLPIHCEAYGNRSRQNHRPGSGASPFAPFYRDRGVSPSLLRGLAEPGILQVRGSRYDCRAGIRRGRRKPLNCFDSTSEEET
jgi:hypothetical protein